MAAPILYRGYHIEPKPEDAMYHISRRGIFVHKVFSEQDAYEWIDEYLEANRGKS